MLVHLIDHTHLRWFVFLIAMCEKLGRILDKESVVPGPCKGSGVGVTMYYIMSMDVSYWSAVRDPKRLWITIISWPSF